MGKYNVKQETLTPTENFLQYIASEIAESNRLNRLELKYLIIRDNTDVDRAEFERQLEDRA